MSDELIRIGLTALVILLALAARGAYRRIQARLAERERRAYQAGYDAREAIQQHRHGLRPLPIERKAGHVE